MTKRQKIELQKYFTDAHNHVLRRLDERYPNRKITIKDLKEAPFIKIFPTKGDNNWVTCCLVDDEFVFYVQDRNTKMFHTVLTEEQVKARIEKWGLGITFTNEELRHSIESVYNTLETYRVGMNKEGKRNDL